MSELCNQAEEDLVEKGGGKEIEYRGLSQRDRRCFAEFQEFATSAHSKDCGEVDARAANPEKIQFYYLQ